MKRISKREYEQLQQKEKEKANGLLLEVKMDIGRQVEISLYYNKPSIDLLGLFIILNEGLLWRKIFQQQI